MLHSFGHIFSLFTIRDVNYLVAVVFTIGCGVLVVNACLSFVPFISTQVKLPISILYLEGILSVMTCGLFLTGSVFHFLEVVNANRGGCFGWKLKQSSYSESTESIVEKGAHIHTTPDEQFDYPQMSQANPCGRLRAPTLPSNVEVTVEEKFDNMTINDEYTTTEKATWRFFPTVYELQTYYLHEIGFVATMIFLSCSVLYFSTSIASLATILSTGEIARWIRYPQLVAAMGFALASVMLMIHNQTDWWRPAIRNLRWHINFWNLVGSAGFIFCAVFGLAQHVYWAQYQFGCSYLWGSWAFLVGSVVELYESFDKHRGKRTKELGLVEDSDKILMLS